MDETGPAKKKRNKAALQTEIRIGICASAYFDITLQTIQVSFGFQFGNECTEFLEWKSMIRKRKTGSVVTFQLHRNDSS